MKKITVNEKSNLIEEITNIIGVKINFDDFQLDDLISLKNNLIEQKSNFSNNINKWFDNELYDKIKNK